MSGAVSQVAWHLVLPTCLYTHMSLSPTSIDVEGTASGPKIRLVQS